MDSTSQGNHTVVDPNDQKASAKSSSFRYTRKRDFSGCTRCSSTHQKCIRPKIGGRESAACTACTEGGHECVKRQRPIRFEAWHPPSNATVFKTALLKSISPEGGEFRYELLEPEETVAGNDRAQQSPRLTGEQPLWVFSLAPREESNEGYPQNRTADGVVGSDRQITGTDQVNDSTPGQWQPIFDGRVPAEDVQNWPEAPPSQSWMDLSDTPDGQDLPDRASAGHGILLEQRPCPDHSYGPGSHTRPYNFDPLQSLPLEDHAHFGATYNSTAHIPYNHHGAEFEGTYMAPDLQSVPGTFGGFVPVFQGSQNGRWGADVDHGPRQYDTSQHCEFVPVYATSIQPHYINHWDNQVTHPESGMDPVWEENERAPR